MRLYLVEGLRRPDGDQPQDFLAEVAVSEDQANREQEERELKETIAFSEDENAARVAAENLVSLSETEDESATTMETHIELVETPNWSTSAQDASLSNTLTALAPGRCSRHQGGFE